MTLHGNIWFSENNKSGDASLQIEDFNKTGEIFCDANGVWLGHVGDIRSTHCKSKGKLLFTKESYDRKRLGVHEFVDDVPSKVRKEMLKHDKKAETNCVITKQDEKKLAEMKGSKKSSV